MLFSYFLFLSLMRDFGEIVLLGENGVPCLGIETCCEDVRCPVQYVFCTLLLEVNHLAAAAVVPGEKRNRFA